MIPDEQLWETAAAKHDEAVEALAEDRVADAERLAARAWADLCAAVGAEHPDAGNARATLAEIALRKGNFSEALDMLAEAVATCLPWTGDPGADPIRWRAQGLQAEALTRLARYAEARAALDAMLAELEPGSAEARDARNMLGVLLRFQGQWADAERIYLGALADTADDDPDRSVILHNLSGLASARGDFAGAERWARQALSTHDDRRSRRYATDLAGLADALLGQGRHGAARTHYRRVIALLQAHDADDPEIAYAQHNLGDALAALHKPREAEAAYQAALTRKIAIFGDRHPEVAGTLCNLAALRLDEGRTAEARVFVARALSGVEGLEADHPIRAAVLAFASGLDG